jgi:5-methylcytosine-specific restriction endonuclease McrA
MPLKRLPPDDYRRLRIEVLDRDGWRCQSCGVRTNLDVHHIEMRAKGGSDSVDNLIVLCRVCHAGLHGQRYDDMRI